MTGLELTGSTVVKLDINPLIYPNYLFGDYLETASKGKNIVITVPLWPDF